MARVLVPLAEGCEEIEAVTIIDLLRRAGIEVVVAGLRSGPVRASRGVQILPDTVLDAVLGDDFDMIALPGGMPGAATLRGDPRILKLVRDMSAAGRHVAAICAAPMVLAEAGVLEHRRATSYPGFLDEFPAVERRDEAVVCDGPVLTSRGPGTAMDFALALVETLAGKVKRQQVEAALQRPA